MKDFLTNAQPCISSVAPSPFVDQSHSDCEKAGSTSPVDIQHTSVSELRGLAGFRNREAVLWAP